MKTTVSANNARGSSPRISRHALERAKSPRTTSLWRVGDHLHRWHAIGAHTLIGRHKAKGQFPYPERQMQTREVREVFVCRFCPEVRVKIRHPFVYSTRRRK